MISWRNGLGSVAVLGAVFALGIVTGWALQSRTPCPLAGSNEGTGQDNARSVAAMESLRTELAATNKELAVLRERFDKARALMERDQGGGTKDVEKPFVPKLKEPIRDEVLTRSLKLEEYQRDLFAAALSNYQAEMTKFTMGGGELNDETYKKMIKLNVDLALRLREFLSPEQMRWYLAFRGPFLYWESKDHGRFTSRTPWVDDYLKAIGEIPHAKAEEKF